MNEQSIFIFFFAIAIGAYTQTVTGFAMGLIIMGITASLQLVPISFIAAIINLTGLTNVILAVYKDQHHINWQLIRIVIISFIPAMVAGIGLLYYLDQSETRSLQLILGIVIMLGGVLLVLKPHPNQQRSPSYLTLLAGASAGVMGGMFSTSAPPLIYYLYKQPLAIKTIRSTLLMTFMIAAIARIGVIGSQGLISTDILLFTLYSLPIVFLFTWLGKNYPPPLSDINMRRTAFALLIILGISTTITAF